MNNSNLYSHKKEMARSYNSHNPGNVMRTDNPKQEKAPLEQACGYLTRNILIVGGVTQWAGMMRYSISYFSRKINEIFGENAKQLFQKAKLKAVLRAFLKNPCTKALVIAEETGFRDDRALGQFLSRNFRVTIKEVRKMCIRIIENGSAFDGGGRNGCVGAILLANTESPPCNDEREQKLRSIKVCKSR